METRMNVGMTRREYAMVALGVGVGVLVLVFAAANVLRKADARRLQQAREDEQQSITEFDEYARKSQSGR